MRRRLLSKKTGERTKTLCFGEKKMKRNGKAWKFENDFLCEKPGIPGTSHERLLRTWPCVV